MRRAYGLPFFLIARFIRRGNFWTAGLTVFLMAVAFINLIFITSLFNGIIEGTNQQIIDTYTGHLMLMPKTDEALVDADALVAKVETLPGVQAASSQLQLPANFTFGDSSGSWPVLVINPSQERQITKVADRMISGSYLEPNDTEGIIIGLQIAGGTDVENDAFSLHNVSVGDRVNVSFDGINHDYTVRGIFQTKFINTDERSFITQAALNKIAPAYNDTASTVTIRLADAKNQSAVRDEIIQSGISAKVLTWQDAAGLMKTVTKSFLSINALMTFVGVLIAAVTIFIVIYVDVVGRRRQIGILRAIGLPTHVVQSTFILQALYYAFLGVVFGTGLFFGAIVPYFQHHPFRLPICDAVLVIDGYDFAIRAAVVIIVAIFSGLIPVLVVTRGKLLNAIIGK